MRKRFYVYLVVILAIMASIFIFSSQNGSESGSISSKVLHWILSVAPWLPAALKVFLRSYIRKCAHFTIYMILGIFLALESREVRLHRAVSRNESEDSLSIRETWDDMMGSQIFTGKRIGGLDGRPEGSLVSHGLGRDAGYFWNTDPDKGVKRHLSGSGVGILGAFVSLVIAAVYAASDEWHQSFVADRSAEWSDVLLDSCGALTGIVIVWIICGIIGAVRSERMG